MPCVSCDALSSQASQVRVCIDGHCNADVVKPVKPVPGQSCHEGLSHTSRAIRSFVVIRSFVRCQSRCGIHVERGLVPQCRVEQRLVMSVQSRSGLFGHVASRFVMFRQSWSALPSLVSRVVLSCVQAVWNWLVKSCLFGLWQVPAVVVWRVCKSAVCHVSPWLGSLKCYETKIRSKSGNEENLEERG